jgi:hypothetical protein
MPVDLEILMDQYVSKASDGNQLLRQSNRQHFVLGKKFEQVFGFSGQVQSQIRDGMIADIQYRLDRELQVPLGVAVNQWILDEVPFVRKTADLSKKCHVFSNFGNTGLNNVAVNQRFGPLGRVFSNTGVVFRTWESGPGIGLRSEPESGPAPKRFSRRQAGLVKESDARAGQGRSRVPRSV